MQRRQPGGKVPPTTHMQLSILIPTLEQRAAGLARLTGKLRAQIARDDLAAAVEILTLADDGTLSIGAKRNQLLDQAGGDFVVFIDDDDDISDDYTRLLIHTIRKHPEIDCIGIRGLVTFRGRYPRPMEWSARHPEIRTEHGVYVRPPQHITPVRRDIARRYRFAEISYSEDFDQARRMRHDQALTREILIDQPLYFYLSRRWWFYQWLLDLTETPRHLLGLRFVNRLRFTRHAGANSHE
ncbi:MAG: glycosyltransferase [Blastocatellia bacterium]